MAAYHNQNFPNPPLAPQETDPLTTALIGTDRNQAAMLLREGGLVAFATETVYGLGANALNVEAVAGIFAAKRRPEFDPLIVHIADRKWLPELVQSIPGKAEALMNAFWPGPLTLILPKTDRVPDLVTSALPTVAVRMPAHPLALELLQLVDLPIAAPSANLFSQISPTTAAHVQEQLGDEVDYILDGGPCNIGVESTVLLVTDDTCRLMRPGGLPIEEIEALIGDVVRTPPTESTTAQPSPGLLLRHYAPTSRLIIGHEIPPEWQGKSIGLLCFAPPKDSDCFSIVEALSPTENLREAAAGFFAALRRLDKQNLDGILAHPFPEHGLGVALNDRLTRAAHPAE